MSHMAELYIQDSQLRKRTWRSRFYVGMTVFMIAMVLIGFWPSYFGPLLRGNAARPLVIHLHGVVFVGWMLLLLTQVVLVAIGRTADHRKVGTAGIVYGFLVLAMGLVVGFAAPMMHVANGEWSRDQAASFLLVILGDMALFGGFFAAAVRYRRKPEIHKRLILLATTALLFAAFGRMAFLKFGSLPFLMAWLSPVLIGVIYDAFTRRRVHTVYLIGVPILLVVFGRVFVSDSEAWLRIGRTLLAAFI
jgi:hypothetical protein